jgi:hypothetical protein
MNGQPSLGAKGDGFPLKKGYNFSSKDSITQPIETRAQAIKPDI